MILDPNGMPILQPTVDNAETATFNDAFAAIGNTRQIQTYKWADNAARTAQTGMGAGDEGYQTDTDTAYRYDGTGWRPLVKEPPWISWATPPTNITVGTGGGASLLQRYKVIAGRYLFQYKYVLGSSGASITGSAPVIHLPFAIRQPTSRFAPLTGMGSLYDWSENGQDYTRTRLNNINTDAVMISLYSGTFTNITASTPWTWGAGDELGGEFWGDPV